MKWYRKAADQGNASAQFNIGFLYEDGFNVAKDYKEALRWYRKAADQGYADAQCSIGVLYEMEWHYYEEALRWYRKAADQGLCYCSI